MVSLRVLHQRIWSVLKWTLEQSIYLITQGGSLGKNCVEGPLRLHFKLLVTEYYYSRWDSNMVILVFKEHFF